MTDGGFFQSKRKVRRLVESMVLFEGVRMLVAPAPMLKGLRESLPSTRVTALPPLFTEPIEGFDPLNAAPLSTLLLTSPLTGQDWLLGGVPGVPLAVVVVERPQIAALMGEVPNLDGAYDLNDYERLR